MRGAPFALGRLSALSVAATLFVAACGGGGAQPTAAAVPTPATGAAATGANLTGAIKIVSSLPRTGSSKGQTDTMVNGFKMALDEANNRVGGATISYEDMDDATPAKGAWDAGKEAENANKAVNDPDVLVYLGTFNS